MDGYERYNIEKRINMDFMSYAASVFGCGEECIDKEENRRESDFYCKACDLDLKNRDFYENHLREFVHLNRYAIHNNWCRACDYRPTTRDQFRNHIHTAKHKLAMAKYVKDQSLPMVYCSLCKDGPYTDREFYHHQRKKTHAVPMFVYFITANHETQTKFMNFVEEWKRTYAPELCIKDANRAEDRSHMENHLLLRKANIEKCIRNIRDAMICDDDDDDTRDANMSRDIREVNSADCLGNTQEEVNSADCLRNAPEEMNISSRLRNAPETNISSRLRNSQEVNMANRLRDTPETKTQETSRLGNHIMSRLRSIREANIREGNLREANMMSSLGKEANMSDRIRDIQERTISDRLCDKYSFMSDRRHYIQETNISERLGKDTFLTDRVSK